MATATVEQAFTISALAAIWLPAAYEPRAVDAHGVDVRYDEDSATLIVDNDVDEQRRHHLPGHLGVAPHRRRATSSGRRGEVPSDIRDRFLELPDEFSPQRAGPRRRRSRDGSDAPTEQARALQDYFRDELHLRPRRCSAGHSDDAIEDFLFDDPGGLLRAVRRHLRGDGPRRRPAGPGRGRASPRATRTTTSPGCTTCGASTPTPGPRCTSTAPGGCPSSRRRAAARPAPRRYTGVPEQQAAAGDPGGTVTVPSTATTEAIPAGTPTTAADRDPFTEPRRVRRWLGGDGGDATPLPSGTWVARSLAPRRSSRSSSSRTPSCSRWGSCSGGAGADGGPAAPLAQVRAGVGRDASRTLALARLRGAAERHLRRARPPPGRRAPRRRGRRRSRWPRARRRPPTPPRAPSEDDAARRAGGRRRAAASWPGSRRRGAGGSGAGSTRARSSGRGAATTRPASDASRSPRGATSSRSGSWSAAATAG